MKKKLINIFLFIILLINVCYAEDFLNYKPKGFVNDFAGILTSENYNRLESLLRSVERQSGIEIAVVMLPSIGDYSIEEAAVELFEKWGIGKKGKDNGLLFILAVNERKVRIEVGYGLEEAITDGLAGRIRDNYALPYFRKNDFNQGTYATVLALIQALNKYYQLNLNFNEKETVLLKKRSSKRSLFGIIFKILFFLIFIFGGFGRFFPFLFFPFLFGGNSSSGGGFGSGGGSFGGGFGGFGGGMSGGGGASGSF